MNLNSKRTILVLGAGLVARPLLRYLLRQHDNRLVVATLDVERGIRLMGEHPRGHVIPLDVRNNGEAEKLVGEADVVVSLLPAELNPTVARMAVRQRTPMVSTSYAAPEMWELDDEAKKADILILNEMGLDPGIDHMSAASLARQIRSVGGTITDFSSCCGGFPALDANTNPWGYKFSWSPRAVMMAGRQPARYLQDGREVNVRGAQLFAHSWRYEVEGLGGIFEIYPNRDSVKYIPRYRLEGVKGMFRGTIRYPGWCATMKAAAHLGLFELEERDWPAGTTYGQFLTRRIPSGPGSLSERVADYLGISEDSEVIARLEWAGLLSDRRLPAGSASPIDIFGNRLMKLMMYEPGERDMVALKHVFHVTYPDGSHEEIRASLVQIGEPWGDSAMARTVSFPAAIATNLILEDAIGARGVQVPVLREIFEPVLEELEERGIVLKEEHLKSFRSPFEA